MKNNIYIIIFCLSPLFCLSQDVMETDRPDQTECSSVVQPGSVQVETGFIYSADHSETAVGALYLQSFNYGTTLIRIGVFNAAEIRLEIGEYEKTKERIVSNYSSLEGFRPFVVGTKIAVCEEKGLIPEIAFIGHLELPFGDKKFVRKNEILPSFRFSLSHTFTPKLSLGYNLGMEWSNGLFPDYIYTLTLGADVSEKMGLYIETFGSFSKPEYPQSSFDCGITYDLLNNLQLDASGGCALNEATADLYISAGVSFRLPH